MAISRSRDDLEKDKFEETSGEEAGVRTLARDPGPISEERDDESLTNRTIFGIARGINIAQTANLWKIWSVDSSGTQGHTRFAESPSGTQNKGFVHAWSDRQSLFTALAFLNENSIQLTGATNSTLIGPASADYNFANTDGFSIGGWVKSTDGGTTDMIHKMSGANNGYMIEVDSSGRVVFEFRGTGTGDRIRVRTDSISPQLFNGDWRFWMITKASGSAAASTVTLYTGDGATLTTEVLNVLNDTLTGTTTSATQIGVGNNNTGAARTQGNFDEVAIWNAELTLAEVTEVFNAGNGPIDLQSGSGQISSALVAYWRMGDGSFASLPTIPDEEGTNDLTAGSAVVSGDIETETPP